MEKPTEFLGTGHQCKYGLIPLSVLFMRVWRHLLGLWGVVPLGVVPPACILVLSLLFCYGFLQYNLYHVCYYLYFFLTVKLSSYVC
jgi:hypothetical protein